MITKTKTTQILHLGSSSQHKLLQKIYLYTQIKKVDFKLNNKHNNVIGRSIQFYYKHIIHGGLVARDAHLIDTSLSEAKKFVFDNTHYKGDGHDA